MWPLWSPKGDKILFVNNGKLYEVEVVSEPGLRLGSPRMIVDGATHLLSLNQGYGVGPEGDRFIAVQTVEPEVEERESETLRNGIFVVQNWLAELED